MSGKADRTLAYAVRAKALARYGGLLAISLAGIALMPAVVAVIAGEFRFALHAGLVAGILAGVGFGLSRAQGPHDLLSNEALAIIALGYLLTAILMSGPMVGAGIAPLDALFHSMSAVTTTGLTTLEGLGSMSTAFLFTQAWMQWYGGLVIIVLAVFLVGPGAAAKRLSVNEIDEADVLTGTRTRAQRTLMIYAALTIAGVLLLVFAGAGWRDALLHGLTAVSTGGFSSRDASLAGTNLAVQVGTIALALLGAVSFGFYQNLASRGTRRGGHRQPIAEHQFVGLLVACTIATLLLALTLSFSGDRPWREILRHAPLLAVSAQTTAGFSSLDVSSLDAGSKGVLIVSMLIGGDMGSTAGGLKIFRVLLLLRLVEITLLRTALPPHAVMRPALGPRTLESRDVENAVGIVAMYALVIAASWLAFLAHGHDALDALFEVTSATGTVGLSTGLAGPELAPLLKTVLIVDMWMGRLDIVAVLILCRPQTWFGRRAEIS